MAGISEDEKLRRQNIAASVIGTNAMEGLTLDAETLSLVHRFEEGELSIEQLSAGIEQHVRQMLGGRRTKADVAEHAVGAA